MNSSWSVIEEDLLTHYEDGTELEEPSKEFLKRIHFLKNGDVSDIGTQYIDSKFIFENGAHKEILRQNVLDLQEIRELCQSFYGQQTDREKVERFLKSKFDISSNKEVGRILMLLSYLDVASYHRPSGSVQFVEVEQVEAEDQDSYRVTHRTPYSNLKRFRRAMRECNGDLLWVAKHFPKKGLEPLSDEVTGDKFESVRILCGPANVDHNMRSDFERFQKEMNNRDIEAELRVIINTDYLHKLHDRWILSDEISWNVPPVNSLYGNQEAEIYKTNKELKFEDWWDEAQNIISDWNEIQKHT